MALDRATAARSSTRTTALLAAVTFLIATPVALIAARVGADAGGLFGHLVSTVLPGYIRNTLVLAAGVATLTATLGIATAWLVSLHEFPGRTFFRWGLLLPLGIPSYLGAYAYTDIFQFSGPVQSWLRATFDWGRADYWFPEVRSLGGAILILSLALYPYVYLAARTAFVEQSVCVLEVGKTAGLGPWRRFFRIGLPLAWPSIFAGLALVLMETLAEFGAVDYCAVDTFATGIYRTYYLTVPHATTAAAQLSACLLVPIALLVAAEAYARRSARFFHATGRYRDLRRAPLRRLPGWTATVICALPVVLGFVVPTTFFLIENQRGGDARTAAFLEFGRNSLILATIASLLAVTLALAMTYGRRRHPTWFNRLLIRIAGLGYAIPGSVVAIGVLIPLTWLDHRLHAFTQAWWGVGTGLLFTGSMVAVVYGYLTRFLAVSLNFVQAGLTRVRPSLDDAARTLGAPPLRVLWSVHLPMLRGTLTAAALLVFVDVIKELPATMILGSNFQTLAVRVHHLASDERLTEASTGALAIIAVGLLPVALLARTLDRARPGRADAASSVETSP